MLLVISRVLLYPSHPRNAHRRVTRLLVPRAREQRQVRVRPLPSQGRGSSRSKPQRTQSRGRSSARPSRCCAPLRARWILGFVCVRELRRTLGRAHGTGYEARVAHRICCWGDSLLQSTIALLLLLLDDAETPRATPVVGWSTAADTYCLRAPPPIWPCCSCSWYEPPPVCTDSHCAFVWGGSASRHLLLDARAGPILGSPHLVRVCARHFEALRAPHVPASSSPAQVPASEPSSAARQRAHGVGLPLRARSPRARGRDEQQGPQGSARRHDAVTKRVAT